MTRVNRQLLDRLYLHASSKYPLGLAHVVRNTCSAIIKVTANLTQTEKYKMPYEEIQCYYSVRCFLHASSFINPLAFNYLRYVQQKKRIVGEQLSEMRPGLKCVPKGWGWGAEAE